MIKKFILGNMKTNCYIVINNKQECLVIDPGDNGKKISNYIDENGLHIQAILITHGHFDHIGAVDYLYNKYHCPVYAHKETLRLLKDIKLNLSTFDKPLIVESPVIGCDKSLKISDYNISWILLEGHCQGSSMIYIKEENALFSGDVLFKGSIGRYDFPTSSKLETKKTLKKICEFSFDARLLPGHGDESTLSFEQMNNPFLNN